MIVNRKLLFPFYTSLILYVISFLLGFVSTLLCPQDVFIFFTKNDISVKKGMSKEEVIRRLGLPDEIITRHNSPIINIFDNLRSKRVINGEVLFYARYGYYMYVFIDTNEKVESILFGGA